MSFTIAGLDPEPFEALHRASDAELAARNILRKTVDADPGYPCRVTLADAQIGETVLLLNYEHQPAPTPFRASHAIYVRERAAERVVTTDAIPAALARRTLSIRAFDEEGMMIDAGVTEGSRAGELIERLFENPRAAYLHAHYAAMGCYAARITRS